MKEKRDEIMNPEQNPDSDEAKLMRVRFREVSHFNCWVRPHHTSHKRMQCRHDGAEGREGDPIVPGVIPTRATRS